VDPAERLSNLPPDVRADLLRVLRSLSNVRADTIRQFHERGAESMVEVLVELEQDDLLRYRVILALQNAARR
jgi:ACT domain-containing protein